MKSKKIFCGGVLCGKRNRKKCRNCGIYACGICSKVENKIFYCIDCYVEIGIKEEWNIIKKKIIKIVK